MVISASHNPPEYNGIKIFDSDGTKLCDQKEEKVESLMASIKLVENEKLGRYMHKDGLQDYCTFLQHCTNARLNGLKIALDCSNGATGVTAKTVFEKLGARVFVFFAEKEGKYINCNCGATQPQSLAKKVVDLGCHAGFCFDGDGDRVIAIDENAFYNCNSIKQIKLSSDIETIPFRAFSNCNLESIIIPDSVKLIDENAFELSLYLQIAVIPAGVKIEDSAFRDCLSFRTVFFRGTEAQFSSLEISGNNDPFRAAKAYYYSEQSDVESGKFWKYSDSGAPMIIISKQ